MSIKIQGAPRDYNEQELQSLQAARRNVYMQVENKERITAEFGYDLIALTHKKLLEGYAMERTLPIALSPLNNYIYLRKPKDVQEEEMLLLDEQVKKQYIEELQKEREEYKTLLVAQLMEAEEEKERKKQEQAKAKRLADIQAQAEQCYGDLVIPN